MAKANKTEAPVEPVTVAAVNGTTTRLTGRGIVTEVQTDRMGTRQMVAALPVPGEQEDAIRKATSEAATRRYREAATALVADLIAEWKGLAETHREWLSAAAKKRTEASGKRAEAAMLRGKPGRTADIVTLRSDAAKLEDEARYDDQGADDVAVQLNDLRDRITVALDAANSSLTETATAPDDAATGRAMAKLAAVLNEVMPVLIAAHAGKVARGELIGSGRAEFIEQVAPRVRPTSEPEPKPVEPPTKHPAWAARPTVVATANPAGGFLTPDQYDDATAGTATVNSRGRPLPDGVRYAKPGEAAGM